MSHWAEIDENNIVVRVTVGDNNDPNGDEGYQWLIDNLGGRWVKTSWYTRGGMHIANGIPLRKNYAGIGMSYDEERDAFIAPKPYENWILNESSCLWEPPIPRPTDEKTYIWNQDETCWVEVE